MPYGPEHPFRDVHSANASGRMDHCLPRPSMPCHSSYMDILSSDALLVVDVQNDFVCGSMAIPGAETVIAPINRVVALFPVVIVATDWHPPGHVSFRSSHPGVEGDAVAVGYGTQRMFPDHCVQGSWGAELHPALRLDQAQLILRKGFRLHVDSYGCFTENDGVTDTGLAGYLRARSVGRVFLAGLARFGCVAASALGAVEADFSAELIEDGTAGREGPGDAEVCRRLVEAGVSWTYSRDLVAQG